MTEALVELDGVSFRYPGAGKSWLLEGIDLQIHSGEILAIVGANGSGKTTLLRLLLGILEPQRGVVRLLGESPEKARHRIGYVPQFAALDAGVPADALDIVLTGRLRRSPWGARYGRQDRERALEALASVGVADLARLAFGELSGGQRQRVLIARALVSEAELLLLDEPTTGIDPLRERGLLELLAELAKQRSVIMVTHDLDIAFQHATRVACVHHRRLLTLSVEEPPSAEEVIELFGVHWPHPPRRAAGPGETP